MLGENEKGDVGMTKCFSGNKGWASTTCNPMSRYLSAPDAISLHHYIKNHHQYCTILCWIQALDTKRPVASLVKGGLLGICHLLSSCVVLFQRHGGMVCHMQVLATNLYIILYTWILTSETILVLAACSWGSDVGM